MSRILSDVPDRVLCSHLIQCEALSLDIYNIEKTFVRGANGTFDYHY